MQQLEMHCAEVLTSKYFCGFYESTFQKHLYDSVIFYFKCNCPFFRVKRGGQKWRDGCSKGVQIYIQVMEAIRVLKCLDINGAHFALMRILARALLKLWLLVRNQSRALCAICSRLIVWLFHVNSSSLLYNDELAV